MPKNKAAGKAVGMVGIGVSLGNKREKRLKTEHSLLVSGLERIKRCADTGIGVAAALLINTLITRERVARWKAALCRK